MDCPVSHCDLYCYLKHEKLRFPDPATATPNSQREDFLWKTINTAVLCSERIVQRDLPFPSCLTSRALQPKAERRVQKNPPQKPHLFKCEVSARAHTHTSLSLHERCSLTVRLSDAWETLDHVEPFDGWMIVKQRKTKYTLFFLTCGLCRLFVYLQNVCEIWWWKLQLMTKLTSYQQVPHFSGLKYTSDSTN